jgi:hypothetical protein
MLSWLTPVGEILKLENFSKYLKYGSGRVVGTWMRVSNTEIKVAGKTFTFQPLTMMAVPKITEGGFLIVPNPFSEQPSVPYMGLRASLRISTTTILPGATPTRTGPNSNLRQLATKIHSFMHVQAQRASGEVFRYETDPYDFSRVISIRFCSRYASTGDIWSLFPIGVSRSMIYTVAVLCNQTPGTCFPGTKRGYTGNPGALHIFLPTRT